MSAHRPDRILPAVDLHRRAPRVRPLR